VAAPARLTRPPERPMARYTFVDMTEVHELGRVLQETRAKGIPHAARDTLNDLAFTGRTMWQDRMAQDMTLRNKFTQRSVQVDKARGTNMGTMQSVVGSRAPYMADQESGATKRTKGKHGVTIPTPRASGEARGTQPRKKTVRSRNKLSSIQLKPRKGASKKQEVAIAIRQAKASGRNVAFLDLGKRKGMFRISGRKLDMIWDMTRPAVAIPKNPTMHRTLRELDKKAPAIAGKALRRQLDRTFKR
jgi:hypothetical protein